MKKVILLVCMLCLALPMFAQSAAYWELKRDAELHEQILEEYKGKLKVLRQKEAEGTLSEEDKFQMKGLELDIKLGIDVLNYVRQQAEEEYARWKSLQGREWMEKALLQLNKGASNEYAPLKYTIAQVISDTDFSDPVKRGETLGILRGYLTSTIRNKDVEIAQKLRDEHITTSDGTEINILDFLEENVESWLVSDDHTTFDFYAEIYGHFSNKTFYSGALKSMYNDWKDMLSDEVTRIKEAIQMVRDLAENE